MNNQLDEFHCHEVLHTLHVVRNLIARELMDHPFTLAHPAVKAEIEIAMDMLGTAYQRTGAIEFKANAAATPASAVVPDRAWRLKALHLARNLAAAQSALDMEAHCYPGQSWQNKLPDIEAAEKALMAHLETAAAPASGGSAVVPAGEAKLTDEAIEDAMEWPRGTMKHMEMFDMAYRVRKVADAAAALSTTGAASGAKGGSDGR